MKIQLTALAAERLLDKIGTEPGYIKMFYETQDCGCDGITVLLIVDEPAKDDVPVDTDTVPFIIDKLHAVYYEESMRLDTDPTYPSYTLNSDSMTYSRNITVRDIRHTNEMPAASSAAAACAVPQKS
ncbi:iron-sulfur cluster biosynthesis family protein [Paenibacillus sp. JX-17]|uniref:Iron-sulfur cluster biosynthesis family protein n=1 Tax=Paenibacillus lacisoli TaxID=3064525 RepID=A0ABT9C8I7_9BACL|nr:iron-sulfur cluster biosynthesis family protein [Paenibacillus sp. JX-17]MDO7905567.1 iron-sulfur cluster biosynthesis family protein [Paenibacillus sp. JX-17]